MPGRSAVIFVPDDAKTPLPLMLYPIMGTPLLTWLVWSLGLSGVKRFFLVCPDAYLEQAKACFPPDAGLAASRDHADLLRVFLSAAGDNEEEIDVVTGPAVYLPPTFSSDPAREGEPVGACICHVSRQTLLDALDDEFLFSQFLLDNASAYTSRDGMFSVSKPVDLARWAAPLRHLRLAQLIRDGVEIWDWDNCYVDPAAKVGAGTVLMPGTIIRGPSRIGYGCILGPNAFIENSAVGNHCTINASHVCRAKIANAVDVGPYAHIRPDSVLDPGVKIGNFVEVKKSHIGADTWASHLSYIGDSEVGKHCNLGCGTVTVNFDRVKKHQTVIDDRAFVGCNSSLIAPVKVGAGAYIAAGSVITNDVPPDALAISRPNQSVKKEWAVKHKTVNSNEHKER